ncbi:hypothetical protein AB4Y96_15965 [Phyllobacterium sp. TAF24]|uniref:hypothetical protein n=1 Tax=Phyllobacterium sp. TAF24 TaxID=3233068 RepID=UPI003F9DAB05
MTDKPSTKFDIPQVWRSPTEISSLIGEAVTAGNDKVDTVEASKQPSPILPPIPQKPPVVQDEQTIPDLEMKRVSPSSERTIERLQIQLDLTVIAETKIRAVHDRTTASAVVEAALRAYLKL